MAYDDNGDLIVLPPPPPSEEIHISAVLKFPAVFWVLTLSCVVVYIDILTFNNNCAQVLYATFYQILAVFIVLLRHSLQFVAQKYLANVPLSQVPDSEANALYASANNIMMITYLVAGLLTPFFGTFIDWIGYRAVLVLVSAIAITGVHLILALTTFSPTVPLVLLGFCYSIYASALWPSIALVIEPKYQATGAL
jgi:MFS family permease